jgi:hypothetical protein
MKRSLTLALLVLAGFSPVVVLADTITTLRGKTFRDCKIAQVHPDGISFTHRSGAAKILYTDLPRSLRDKYGYDPKKADAYSKKLVEQRKEREKRVQEYLVREAEAIEAAQFMNTMRTMQAQTQMMLEQASGYPYYGAPAILNGVAVTPPIHGPVLDGRGYRVRSWDGVGIAPLVPGTGGIYAPPSGGYAFYPPVTPSLGYARPGYGVSGSFNLGGVRVGVGLGAVPGLAPYCPPAPAPMMGVPGRAVISIGR